MKTVRLCSIDGCERPHDARGWCHVHYLRLRDVRICSIDGCEKPYDARGWCHVHYLRWRDYGDPDAVPTGGKLAGRFTWKGADVSYNAAHSRLQKYRGSASAQLCGQCGKRADDWAYDHLDPDERIDPRSGCAYSSDVNHYEALCTSCHLRSDYLYREGKP